MRNGLIRSIFSIKLYYKQVRMYTKCLCAVLGVNIRDTIDLLRSLADTEYPPHAWLVRGT